jgi:hypothetical protein
MEKIEGKASLSEEWNGKSCKIMVNKSAEGRKERLGTLKPGL